MLATLKDFGHKAEDFKTVGDALSAYGLDWEVETRPTVFRRSDGMLASSGGFVVVRNDTEAVLGRVGGDYTPISNVKALSHADRLIESGVAELDAVFELKGGKKVGASLRLKETINVGGEDPHTLYITLLESHDGFGAVRSTVTPIRIWCTNQLALSFRQARNSWSVRHLSSIEEDLKQVRSELELVANYKRTFEATAERLMLQRLSEREVKMIVEAANTFITNEQTRGKNVEAIMETWKTSPLIGDDYRATGWGVLNATTEWVDHKRTYRSPEARHHVITTGFGARVRNHTLDALVAA